MRAAFIAIAYFSFLPDTQARLGEDIWQCRTRYGKETFSAGDTYFFKKAPFSIEVKLLAKKAASITLLYQPGKLSQHPTVGHITALLSANSSGSKWAAPPTSADQQKIEVAGGYWKTEDGKFTAYYVETDKRLHIETAAYIEKSTKESDALQKQRISRETSGQ